MERQVLTAKEKCLDCDNFVKDFFSRQFKCRFGLDPVVRKIETDEGAKETVLCGAYMDSSRKDAPALRYIKRLIRQRMKRIRQEEKK
ncbi:MAG: hypothetical protein NC828_03070 [Candidatus Omnitrophica bacterium]|nr:hypothetical protein [Candidatus Omnitrophota bacterium]